MSLRLHQKHGVNPTICQCYFCGNDKNEIALLGAAYKEEAPMKMIIDLEPCEACKERMETFVALIESESSSMPLKYATGQIIWLKKEAFVKVFNCPLPPKGIAFIELDAVKKIQAMACPA